MGRAREKWARTREFPLYWISDGGRVLSGLHGPPLGPLPKEAPIEFWKGRGAPPGKPICVGKYMVTMRPARGGGRADRSLGRLVWTAFKGSIPKNTVIVRKDASKEDWGVKNLTALSKEDIIRLATARPITDVRTKTVHPSMRKAVAALGGGVAAMCRAGKNADKEGYFIYKRRLFRLGDPVRLTKEAVERRMAKKRRASVG